VHRFRKPAVAIVLAIVAAASAVTALQAQSGATVSAPPQFRDDYAFAGSVQCLHSASASCRRKPPTQSPAELNNAAPAFDAGGSMVRVRGDAATVRLDVRRATIADALAALNGAFNLSYRSAIGLDEEINGTYAGSPRRVIAHVLDGYDYVIKQNGAKLDVVIFGRHGARAIPVAPSPPNPFHPARERRRPQLLGVDHHSSVRAVWRYAALRGVETAAEQSRPSACKSIYNL
jgi:hypothetical protein